MTNDHLGLLWYQSSLDVFLKRWFSNYEEVAKVFGNPWRSSLALQAPSFVGEADVIRVLGLDPEDPDWEKIGRDGAHPTDQQACESLREKREQALRHADGATGGALSTSSASVLPCPNSLDGYRLLVLRNFGLPGFRF